MIAISYAYAPLNYIHKQTNTSFDRSSSDPEESGLLDETIYLNFAFSSTSGSSGGLAVEKALVASGPLFFIFGTRETTKSNLEVSLSLVLLRSSTLQPLFLNRPNARPHVLLDVWICRTFDPAADSTISAGLQLKGLLDSTLQNIRMAVFELNKEDVAIARRQMCKKSAFRSSLNFYWPIALPLLYRHARLCIAAADENHKIRSDGQNSPRRHVGRGRRREIFGPRQNNGKT
jgi:hypothetical protein